MSKPVIRIENLGKQYHVGAREVGYTTFREAVMSTVMAPWHRFRHLSGRVREDHTFWALRNISFGVRQGEILGVIGRNGAGKSTLLKILSQITEPTTGTATLDGRVGSLLEIGSGFHPELTGRENVFLKGAMLGMNKRETAAKFDEIVAFAEVEKFIDTPFKRYSSGMSTRLAFSVAAHLDPEIVIVDEVLAVGDAGFQQKCLGKMGEVASSGRTVLFVSHNMAAVESLCTRAVVLEGGQTAFDGEPQEAIQEYFRLVGGDTLLGRYDADLNSIVNTSKRGLISQAWITSEGEECEGRFPIGMPLEFHVEGRCRTEVFQPQVVIVIENNRGIRICTLHTKCAPSGRIPLRIDNSFAFTCRVPRLPLAPGSFKVRVALNEGGHTLHLVDPAFHFEIRHSDFFDNLGKKVRGLLFVEQEWTAEQPTLQGAAISNCAAARPR
jgi:lipopolysaccharide transport system ATP-binding protein